MAVKDAVLNSATMSDVVLPRMAGAVESLDSMACHQIDNLKVFFIISLKIRQNV